MPFTERVVAGVEQEAEQGGGQQLYQVAVEVAAEAAVEVHEVEQEEEQHQVEEMQVYKVLLEVISPRLLLLMPLSQCYEYEHAWI